MISHQKDLIMDDDVSSNDADTNNHDLIFTSSNDIEADSVYLQQIFVILHLHTGHDFSSYKLSTIQRRIERQMYHHNIHSFEDYAGFLRSHPDELNHLFDDLLIGVTRFFRDSEAFEVLKRNIFAKLWHNKSADYCIRIWIPACSTGEEVYSVIMLIRECMDELEKYYNIQVFATDINLKSLEIARAGFYSDAISEEVSEQRLQKFFIKVNNGYKIKKEIRQCVVFGAQNLIKDPPLTKMDLICCRNLLIYLNSEQQKKIIMLFNYSLKPEGILFLGASESISESVDFFTSIENKWKLFESKKNISQSSLIPIFSGFPRQNKPISPLPSEGLQTKEIDIIASTEKYLLERYLSPCVVVNKKGRIFYTAGRTNKELFQKTPHTSLNISEVVNPDIKIILIPLIKRASKLKTELFQFGIRTKGMSILNLKIMPLESLHGLLLVIFEEVMERDYNCEKPNFAIQKNIDLSQLEEELQYTKENLQATIEELESSNEELQSTNEELQSSNDEIGNAQAELVSLNNELIVVNTELQSRIDLLAFSNDDINNLINSSEIAAFFLDCDLQVRRTTPKAEAYIPLLKSCMTQSVCAESKNKKNNPWLDTVEAVLRTSVNKNLEIQDNNGHWYSIRIFPYLTLLNIIDGVVLIVVDITEQKQAEIKSASKESELQAAKDCAEHVLNA
jgi:two-component system CheB/CheR fusion protein